MTGPAASPAPPERRSLQGHAAGLVTRTLAAIVDGVVVLLALLVTYAVVVGVLLVLSPRRFVVPTGEVFLSLAAAAAVSVLYLTISWWLNGQTYGDRLMGLRLVDHRGGSPGFGVALLRALLCVLFPAGLLWVAFSSQNRSVQDLLARTRVVYDWRT